MERQNCLNAHLDGEALYKLAAPDTGDQSLLDRIADTKKLSARGFSRIFRVGLTLADFDHGDMPGAETGVTAISLFSMLAGGVRIMLYSRNKIEIRTAT